jgi:hypothetical protein
MIKLMSYLKSYEEVGWSISELQLGPQSAEIRRHKRPTPLRASSRVTLTATWIPPRSSRGGLPPALADGREVGIHPIPPYPPGETPQRGIGISVIAIGVGSWSPR